MCRLDSLTSRLLKPVGVSPSLIQVQAHSEQVQEGDQAGVLRLRGERGPGGRRRGHRVGELQLQDQVLRLRRAERERQRRRRGRRLAQEVQEGGECSGGGRGCVLQRRQPADERLSGEPVQHQHRLRLNTYTERTEFGPFSTFFIMVILFMAILWLCEICVHVYQV